MKNKRRLFVAILLLVSILISVGAYYCYPMIEKRVQASLESYVEEVETSLDAKWYGNEETAREFLKSSHVLYVDLEMSEHGDTVALRPEDFLFEAGSPQIVGFGDVLSAWYTDFDRFASNTDYYAMDLDNYNNTSNIANANIRDQLFACIVDDLVNDVEIDPETFNEAGAYSDWFFLEFDEKGEMYFYGCETTDTSMYRQLQNQKRGNLLVDFEREYGFTGTEQMKLQNPSNMVVFYGLRCQHVQEENIFETHYGRMQIYSWEGGNLLFTVALAAAFLAAIPFGVIGRRKRLMESGILSLPMEAIALGSMGLVWMYSILREVFVVTFDGLLKGDLLNFGFISWSSDLIVAGVNILVWTVTVFLAMWCVLLLWPRSTEGFWAYLKERSLTVRILWKLKIWIVKYYHYATCLDITESANKTIWKIVLLNFMILLVISCMWFFGVPALVLYSIALYVFLRKQYSKLREYYDKLYSAAKEMAEGNLNLDLAENLGIFNPLKEQILHIRNGFQSAVEEEVKSQRMKTELITNVSHDLKTPLTAIITYVDLLKKENLTSEERASYVETLEKKSMRLKVLIEDLFEVSKAESKNITFHTEDVDLTNLIKQVQLEWEDKIKESGLSFRWDLPDEKVVRRLDGQRTCRVLENLIGNILKYSMEKSRVYIELKQVGEEAHITMKNISAAELNFDPGEITERFVRGDLSRNTEGSGLGLAIARSFVELQGGSFRIEIDGDLFKVHIVW